MFCVIFLKQRPKDAIIIILGEQKKKKNSLTLRYIVFDCQYFQKIKLIVFRIYLESFMSKL